MRQSEDFCVEMTAEESAIAKAERAAREERALERKRAAHESMTDEEKRDATRKAKEKEEKRLAEWNETLDKIKELRGQRTEVLGDGFCWMYAFLVHYGLMEKPLNPTPKDKALVEALLARMKDFVASGMLGEWGNESRKEQMAAMHTPYEAQGTMGTFSGNALGYPVLSAMLDVPMVSTTGSWMGHSIMKAPSGNSRKAQRMAVDTVEGLAFNEIRPDGRRDRTRRGCSCELFIYLITRNELHI